jgi:hypothetical protein
MSPVQASIFRRARVHLIAPHQNAAHHVPHMLEPILTQQRTRLRAPSPTAAMDHDIRIRIEFRHMPPILARRNELRARNAANPIFALDSPASQPAAEPHRDSDPHRLRFRHLARQWRGLARQHARSSATLKRHTGPFRSAQIWPRLECPCGWMATRNAFTDSRSSGRKVSNTRTYRANEREVRYRRSFRICVGAE